MILKYRSNWRFRPFAALGGTFRRIGEVGASQETFAYGLPTPYGVGRYHIDESLTQGGIVAAGGLTAGHVGPLKLVPELRYTHWTSIRFFPTQNQVEFLLGMMF
jgi:hypothetical protein